MDVVNLVFEPEVKEKFKEIDNRIDSVEDKVDGIEGKVTRMEVKLEAIEQSQARIENTVLQGQNSILTTLQSLVLNNTQKEIAENKNNTDLEITKENNKYGFRKQLLVTGAAFFGGSIFASIDKISNWLDKLLK